MKKFKILTFLLIANFMFSQVSKDLDQDEKLDEVTFDTENGRIVCKLSSQNYKPIYSKEGLSEEGNVEIRETKNGFEFSVPSMRAGFVHQFRYEPKEKKIRLIGMKRYEFGPANNDGSGESSVNLLTGDYIGEWYHFDLGKNELIKLPTIKTKMKFPKVYLDNYDTFPEGEYEDSCSALYAKQVQQYKKKQK